MTWEALNQIGQNYGAPAIDFDGFSNVWEMDPTIQSVVDSFDNHGIIIHTDNMGQSEMPAPDQGKSGALSTMAKRATKRALK